ncbi:Fatty acid hydroxylase superfamily protein [Pseudodesulfovibrio hydrargyri]|uniref:Fatty acid hydroxylase superfamily protein n=1 Tax=Pseudodesulfovibrio hydrargyri TaxID=2125990 RepID=A0A1J5N0G1_9BACT|nr:sterol desaturase family protein [Pseudodesulfovibrio hydrargyri]OIQ51754.1 Fatty acid hydroxylase superfamily protein [Pseudodesulfovibrio hydrargyri]
MTTETLLRLGSFLAILAVMGAAETLRPRRGLSTGKGRRWFANLSVAVLASVLTRVLIPILPAGVAAYCRTHGLGLLHLVSPPPVLAWIVSVLVLDMAIYWQHVLFHRRQLLWRVHRMHHADLDIDASTGIRFHPIEIVLSMLIKLAVVLVLGPPAGAVILFEILLNGCAVFNHANVRIPLHVDRVLRLFLVTPDQHRVHHSTNMREANMNFGFNFPWWDRMFRTYKPQPDLGHERMRIGLNIFRDREYGGLIRMLTIPFL